MQSPSPSSPGGTTPRTPRAASPGGATPRTPRDTPAGLAPVSSSTPARAAIEARDLVKTYPGPGKTRVTALAGLTLDVPAGSVFALVGPNGAGKSSTVKILTTLATPDAGSAVVDGIDVIAAPGRARRVIGVVGQRSGADPGATARENLVLQGHLFGLPARAARARAD